MENCKNCSHPVDQKYCPKCGQQVISLPLNFSTILNWVIAAIDFDSGYLVTLWTLLIDPGKLVNEFLRGRTIKYNNPIKFLLISVAAVVVVASLSEFISQMVSDDGFSMQFKAYTYSLVFFTSNFICLLAFYRSTGSNLAERFVIAFYESGMFCMFLLTSIIIGEIIRSNDEGIITMILFSFVLTYHFYFHQRVFKGKWYIKIFATLFSLAVFILLMILIIATIRAWTDL